MRNFLEMLEEGLKNGKVAVMGFGVEAKDACVEMLDYTAAKSALDDKYYELGAIVYEAYKADPDLNAYKAFLQQLTEIDALVEDVGKLEVAINGRLGKTICPECGTKTDSENKFCPGCGTQLIPDPVVPGLCKKCGTQNPEDFNFCGNCGNKLE